MDCLYPTLSSLYGQLMGYDRWRIRRSVELAAARSPEDLASEARLLFQRRAEDAIRRFPVYAERVKAFRGSLPQEGEEIDPSSLPVWTRQDQRALFDSLRAPPYPGSFIHSTGGSTGVPLRFYVTRASFEWRTAASDRGYSWAGAEEGRRSLYVWGTPVRSPGPLARLKAEMHHRLQRRTYFDSFHFGDDDKRRCCEAVNRLRPPAIVGYAGNLIELACFARDNPGAVAWRATAIVTAAEGLAPGRRELIEQHLGGKVLMSYGSREFMLIGMECERQDGYHIASDNLLVEVVDEGGCAVPPGGTGRIVITDLHNDANPFIRYEIGDLGALAPAEARCACGRPFPRLARVEGRLQEVIRTPEGGRLTALFIPHLMKEFPWIDGYQVVQNSPVQLTLRLVTRGPLDDAAVRPITAALQDKCGRSMGVVYERVDRLHKSPSGKTPIVVTADGGPN